MRASLRDLLFVEDKLNPVRLPANAFMFYSGEAFNFFDASLIQFYV